MGAVKQIEVPEKVFALLERYRRRRRISRSAAIEEFLNDEEFLRLLDEQAKRNRDLSEANAMALADEAVAWVRKKLLRTRKGR